MVSRSGIRTAWRPLYRTGPRRRANPPDGRFLEWRTDFDETVRSFENFSKNDTFKLRQWVERFRPIVEQILIPEAQSPPLKPQRRLELLGQSEAVRELHETFLLSTVEFVMREFEHDVISAGLLFFNGLREIDLRLKGFGHSIPALLVGRNMTQMCRGGSAKWAEAMIADIREHGGEILRGFEPREILCHNGKAVGVRLPSGDEIMAKAFVASGLNPQQTFLRKFAPGPRDTNIIYLLRYML